MKISVYVIGMLVGYLFGCLNPAYVISRMKGHDIKRTGNGNPGASNMTMSFGPKVGAFVAVFDILKSVLAFSVSAWLFPDMPGSWLAAGLMAVVGHMFPFWMKFHGGKGFASFIGVTFCISPLFTAMLFLAGVLVVLITDHIVMMTFLFIVGLPAYMVMWRHEFVSALCILSVSVLIFVRHIENLHKMKTGEEPSVKKVLFKKA